MRVSLLPAAALMVAVAIPSSASAQSWTHAWTLCTVNSFSSCHSVSVTTNAIMSGTTRMGTTISISLHNLQGQGYAYDNTTTSGLYQAFFVVPGQALGAVPSSVVPTTPSGGATGTPSWVRYAGATTALPGVVGYVSAVSLDGNNLIGGCGTGALFSGYTVAGRTCAPASAFTVTFSIVDNVDANQFTSAYIYAANGQSASYCFSDPSQYNTSYSQCSVYAESTTNNVVPEPMTIVLLGTGLLGIAGVQRRRRRKERA